MRLKDVNTSETVMLVRLGIAAVVMTLALGSAACAQPHGGSQPPAAGRTVDLQGDPRAFVDNRHIRAFYALSVETLGKGTKGVDVTAYEQKSYAIFRAMGAEFGPSPEGMQDHLKLIPRQVVQIVKDDPHVLDSFETFAEALIGPR
jgi:hypothetical protein